MEFDRIITNNKAIKKKIVSDIVKSISETYTGIVHLYLDNETNTCQVCAAKKRYSHGRFRYMGKYDTRTKRKVSDMVELIDNFEQTVEYAAASKLKENLNKDKEIVYDCIFKEFKFPGSNYGYWIDLDTLLYRSENIGNIEVITKS
jgi:hypothetical protein